MAPPPAPSRRRGKFRRLVDDFAATLDTHQVAMPLEAIEGLLADRIATVAAEVGITEQTALASYFPDDWGRVVALRLVSAYRDAAPGVSVPAPLLLRVLAALGQAQLFAAINSSAPTGAPREPESASAGRRRDRWLGGPRQVCSAASTARYDPITAAEASTALALALHAAPGAPQVTLTSGDLAAATETLTAFADLVARGRWVGCHCCDPAAQQEQLIGLLTQLASDRDHLEHYLSTEPDPADPGEQGPPAPVVALRAPQRRRRPPS